MTVPEIRFLVDRFRLKWWLCPLLILFALLVIPWTALFVIAVTWLAFEFTLTVIAIRSLLRRRV